MSKHSLVLIVLMALSIKGIKAQSPVADIFPKGTITYANVPYANDTMQKHLLDIYLPANASTKTPLVIWVHGGAWMLNDKYADMGYMKETIRAFNAHGYALASIDYRYSTTAIFPAQLQDCDRAVQFLYDNAAKYKLDKDRIALIGFSAGGHLASLLALSNNNRTAALYGDKLKSAYKIKLVLDFYGPSDFIALSGSPDTAINNARNPVAILLGAQGVDRPDLAKSASPVTYVDKDDPPFFIVQGEKDDMVPNTQSKMLSSWLTLAGVKNELTIVPGAPHYGVMFDAEWIRTKLFAFMDAHY